MKNYIRFYFAEKRIIAAFCFLIFLGSVSAQNTDELNYVDAHALHLIGQGFDNPQVDFGRLPAGFEFRQALTYLGTNSSGLALRFSTNSRKIAIKWTVRNNAYLDRTPMTGLRGLDLYALDKNDQWVYTGTTRMFGDGPSYVSIVAENLVDSMTDFIAYLPLWDGIVSLEIGIEKDAVIGKPEKESLTKSKDVKPIVFYGTSITQGGCASRPGMVYPAILGRMLNRETINLGFSGNGRLDFSIAEAITLIDAEALVIDCLWNCTPKMVTDSAYHFISHIAKAKPQMKIFMCETRKYVEWEMVYKQLVTDGYHNIIYVKSADFIGTDGEATVDGCHYTDLGFYRFANALYPFLKNLPMLKGKYKPTDESLKQYKYPEWFRDAKIGIWAHWSPQAVPRHGSDWYGRFMYQGI
ncbi:MAG: alpha-L-fucosidase [Candidatus Symbiothrix sp.]|jgi:hypothetical protein|nr:alpha-L-fucosidase [Candidatus Symbiothrix sp.]